MGVSSVPCFLVRPPSLVAVSNGDQALYLPVHPPFHVAVLKPDW